MNIVVFDTETVSIDKPFCYNVGFVIYNTDLNKIIEKREYCIDICNLQEYSKNIFSFQSASAQ